MLTELLSRWPLIQQIRNGSDGTGAESFSQQTRSLRPRHDGAEATPSICPYCGVGCGQIVYHKEGKLISIEGDPNSPISRGHLCPKGAATYQLHTHAERLWDSRDRTFQEQREGEALMQTTAIGHLGGATLDNEENYLIRKLFTAGLGMVCISNQARI